jgi:hypothetical protein
VQTPAGSRTNKQNRALHLYFQMLADELNNAGLDVRRTLREDMDIPWTPYLIKELIWRKVMVAQLGKESTTEMTTKDIDTVFNTITRHLAEKHGIVTDWPSIETIIRRQDEQSI